MIRLPLLRAAELVRLSYLGAGALPPLKAKETKGAQAYLTMDDVLVIPGTNEFSDWTDYNLRAFHAKGAQVGWAGANPGIAAATWHFGFARHALDVAIFMGARQPSFIIGHSLGAGSAQILGCHYQVPTVCFAPPRPCFGVTPIPGENWVLNLVHSDDIIGAVLSEQAGFRRLGSVRGLTLKGAGGISHTMPHYEAALIERINQGTIDPDWPPRG